MATKKAKEPTPYTVESWAGKPKYQCSRCAFNTLDREGMVEHVITNHVIKEAAS